MKTLVIGITGGIGSGKSTVADHLAGKGITVVDADQAARVVVEPQTDALNAIASHFGKQILKADGSLDRRALREIIFLDEIERRWLEALLHPLIKIEIRHQLEASCSLYTILVSPLLLETDQYKLANRIAVVDIPAELQLQRAMARDGIDQSQAEAIIKAQADRTARLAKADDVIDNSGTPEALHKVLDILHQQWLTMADEHSQRS